MIELDKCYKHIKSEGLYQTLFFGLVQFNDVWSETISYCRLSEIDIIDKQIFHRLTNEFEEKFIPQF